MTSRFVAVEKFSKEMTGIPKKAIYSAMKDGRLKWAPFGKRKLIDVQAFENDLAALVSRTVSTPGVSEFPAGEFRPLLKKLHREIKLVKNRTY